VLFSEVGGHLRRMSPGLADKPRVVDRHVMIWAWRHSWCELESTSVPAAV
jgi:hypothetical protein